MRGVHQKITSDLSGIAGQAGNQAGARMGSAMGDAMRKGVEIAAKSTAAIVAATSAVAVKSLVSGYSRMTTIQDSAAALTISLGDSAAAAQLLDDVLGVVRGTPFNLDDFAAGAQQMAGMGIEAGKIPGYLEAIGEASATQGGRAGEMANRLITVFGQIQAQGQVTLQDVWRISDTGVNALAILANHYGVTTDSMKKMISEGAVPASEALDVLQKGIMEGSDGVAGRTVALAGTMEALRRTVSGSVAGIEPAMARMGAAFLEPFSPLIVAGANALAGTFDVLGDRFGDLAARIASSSAFETLVLWLERAPGAVDGFLDALAPAAPMIGAVVTGLTLFGTAASKIPVLGAMAGSIHPLVGAFAALALATPEAREALADVIQTAAPLAQELGRSLVPVLENLADIAAQVLPAAIDLFGTALSGVLTVAVPLADIVASLTGFLADHSGIVMAAAGAYLAWKGALAGAAAWSAATAAIEKLTRAWGLMTATAQMRNVSVAAQGMGQLQTAIAGAGGAAGPAGIAVVGFGALIGYGLYNNARRAREALEKARETVDEFVESLNIDPTDLSTVARALEYLRDRQDEAAASAAELSGFLGGPMYREAAAEAKLYGDEIASLEDDHDNAFANMTSILWQTGESFDSIRAKAKDMGVDLTQSGVAGEDAAQEIVDAFKEADAAARVTLIPSTMEDIAASAELAAEKFDDWKAALDNAMGVQPSLLDAQVKYHAALATVNETLAENGQNFDVSTEAGRNNIGAMIGLRDAGLELAGVEGQLAGSTEHSTNVTALHRGEMVRLMEQFGFTRGEAERYVNQLGLTPDTIDTLAEFDNAEALRRVRNTITVLDQMPGTKTITAIAETATAWQRMNDLTSPKTVSVTARITEILGSVPGMSMFGLAGGGYLDQRFGGTPGRDSIPAMLMPGEYVVRKSAVDRLGVQFLDKLNKGLPGYAAGGPVRATASPMRITVPQRAPAQVQRTGPAVHIDRVEVTEEVDVDVFAKRLGFLASAGSL